MGQFEQGYLIRYKSLGHFQVTVSSSAVPLPGLNSITLGRVRRVVIRTLTGDLNWRDDGTAPTSTTGQPLLHNEVLVYDGESLTDFEMILAASATGDADVRVSYHGL